MTSAIPVWLDASPWRGLIERADQPAVDRALMAEQPEIREFAALLSPAAGDVLEALAQRAQALTRRHFGRTIALYAPLYLSNYCCSGCIYCGFASNRDVSRHKLTPAEFEAELTALKDMGLEEVLLLTGERNAAANYEYVRDCVAQTASHFHSVTVEVFPMSEEEYHGLAAAGCTGVTLYQETYDPVQYERLHLWGPKRDYARRLDAPVRALAGGIRTAGLGALLGLSDPFLDLLCLYRHANYLRQRFWKGGVSICFTNPGGIRADIKSPVGAYPYNVVWNDMYTVQPFDNLVVLMDLTGAQIKAVLEQCFPPTATSTKMLQVSGIKYTVQLSAPANAKIVGLTLADGTPINPATVYRVAVNNFLATGGDGFSVFIQGTNQFNTGISDVTALVDYVLWKWGTPPANTPFSSPLQGRITVVP